jgi:hypothetical protein
VRMACHLGNVVQLKKSPKPGMFKLGEPRLSLKGRLRCAANESPGMAAIISSSR